MIIVTQCQRIQKALTAYERMERRKNEWDVSHPGSVAAVVLEIQSISTDIILITRNDKWHNEQLWLPTKWKLIIILCQFWRLCLSFLLKYFGSNVSRWSSNRSWRHSACKESDLIEGEMMIIFFFGYFFMHEIIERVETKISIFLCFQKYVCLFSFIRASNQKTIRRLIILFALSAGVCFFFHRCTAP